MPTADESKARDKSPDVASRDDTRERERPVGAQGLAPMLARLTMIGWFVAASISVGAIAGWWLDGRFGTAPVLLIGGLLVGVAVALVGMVRMLQAVGSK